MDAIAILHADPATVAPLLVGVDVEHRADFVLVPLGVPLASETNEIVGRLQEVAAAALELHGEPRGVPVIPSTLKLEATTWSAAVEELGELADWVQFPSLQPEGGLAGLMGAFAGMTPGGGMPDMAVLAAALEGESGKALLGQAMDMAQQLAAEGKLSGLLQSFGGAPPMAGLGASMPSPEQMKRELERAANSSKDFSKDSSKGSSKDARSAQAQADMQADMQAKMQDMMQGMDLDDLATQAQALLKDQPELEKTLRERLGNSARAGAKPDGSDGD